MKAIVARYGNPDSGNDSKSKSWHRGVTTSFLHFKTHKGIVVARDVDQVLASELVGAGIKSGKFHVGDTVMVENVICENTIVRGLMNLVSGVVVKRSAQQVDSAEASTITVPPSMPPGSPR